MNVHLGTPGSSFAINKLQRALEQYAPPRLTFTGYAEAAAVVVHVTGQRDALRRLCAKIQQDGKRYLLIQHTLRGTQKHRCQDWLELWRGALCVWSHQNLWALCDEDGCPPSFNLYYAPLGVDPLVFWHRNTGPRPFVVATSGGLRACEGVEEAFKAARRLKRPVIHLGARQAWGNDVLFSDGCPDDQVAALLNQCEFAIGLRRHEGFELPAAEGLLCGARPIVYDAPHYRHWYEGLAEFIPETTRGEVAEALFQLFQAGPRPVTPAEQELARERFHWPRIVEHFWRHL